MQHPTSPRRVSRRVYVHAYEHLTTELCAEIQRGHYPTKAVLAQKLERTPRTIQTYLRVLQGEQVAPLAFDHVRNGFYFTDPGLAAPRHCPDGRGVGQLFFGGAPPPPYWGQQPECNWRVVPCAASLPCYRSKWWWIAVPWRRL